MTLRTQSGCCLSVWLGRNHTCVQPQWGNRSGSSPCRLCLTDHSDAEPRPTLWGSDPMLQSLIFQVLGSHTLLIPSCNHHFYCISFYVSNLTTFPSSDHILQSNPWPCLRIYGKFVRTSSPLSLQMMSSPALTETLQAELIHSFYTCTHENIFNQYSEEAWHAMRCSYYSSVTGTPVVLCLIQSKSC